MRCFAGIILHRTLTRNHRIMTSTTTPLKRPDDDLTITTSKTPKRTKVNAKSTPSKSSSAKKDQLTVLDVEEYGFIADDLPNLRSSLLQWYDTNHRILPWRRNPHSRLSQEAIQSAATAGQHPAPDDLTLDQFTYYVWVCEIMSQQTQVSRAAEYFRKWVARWPDVQSLSQASQEDVNEMWAGLGYYRRARFLLEGAKYVVDELDGKFPKTANELKKIPGVGAYTSCAIASIAQGEQVAVVDGNVIRVIARMRQVAGDPKSAAMTKLFTDLAGQMLDPDRPGDFNQAMMELGATVCVPNTHPNCSGCPVNAYCKAYKAEQDSNSSVSVTDYPTKVEKPAKREESVAVAVVQVISNNAKASDKSAGQFVLLKRPQGGLLAGLWEFPLVTVDASSSREEKMEAIDGLLKKNGVVIDDTLLKLVERKNLGEVVHVFSHVRMTMHVEKMVLQVSSDDVGTFVAGISEEDTKEESTMQWLTSEQLSNKGLSSGVKKVFQLFMKEKASASAQSITKFFKPKKNDDA